MIKEQDFTPDQKRLYETMSRISEDCWCAGWLIGNEYAIWKAASEVRSLNADLSYGLGEMDIEDVEECARLRDLLKGWIIWYDDEDEPGLDVSEWGPRFVTLEEWKEFLEKDEHVDRTRNRTTQGL